MFYNLQDEVHTYIVTEYLRGGELLQRIRTKKRFTELETSKYMRKLASVIDFMHRQGVVHRDLKPEVKINLLLQYKENNIKKNFIIKEGDISFKGQLVVQKSCRNLAFDKKMPISFCCEILLQFSDRTFCIQFGVNLIKLKYVRNLLTTAKILENNLHFFSWIYRALKMVSAKPKIVRKWCT